MNNHDDLADSKLPVTAELGDEGGSYGDATVQAETLKGVLGNDRVDPKRAGPEGGQDTAVASEGEQVRESEDVVRFATEPPQEKR